MLNLRQIDTMANFPFIKKIPPFLRNKYVFVGVVFFVWILFFDDSNIINRISNSRELRQLEAQKTHYIEEIEMNKKRLEELTGDEKAIEKFAREQYHMKKDGEEIFIIEEE